MRGQVNELQRQIEQYMLTLEDGGNGTFAAVLKFPACFVGFQGHFPGNPILPAVCQIQAVVVAVRKLRQAPVHLRQINLAKFFAPVTCGEECRLECRMTPAADSELVVKAVISRGKETVTKIDLTVALDLACRGGTHEA